MKIVKGISWIVVLIVLLSAVLLVGCNKGPGVSGEDTALLNMDPSFKQKGSQAVCLSAVNLFEKPDAGSKWLGSLVPGLTVNYLNKTENGPAYKDKNGEWVNGDWFNIETPDNKNGWALAALVAENATPAAIIEETSTYSMPTEVSLAADKLKPMDTIAIVGEKDGGWVKVVKVMGAKSKPYWIKSASMSKEGTDFAVALLFTKETGIYNQKKDKDAYLKALKNIKGMSGSNSIFAGIIEEALANLGESAAEQPVAAEEATSNEPAQAEGASE